MIPILSSLGLVTVGTEAAWAVVSDDDRYRYVLGRTWNPTLPLWLFGMLNPSKARIEDDHTIRKCIGFSTRGGAGGFVVVNMLAYSATDPKDMVRAAADGMDVRGEHNIAAIRWALDTHPIAGLRIAAWGKVPRLLQARALAPMMLFLASEPSCLGVNGDGSPCHPLRLSYATPIVRFFDAKAQRGAA